MEDINNEQNEKIVRLETKFENIEKMLVKIDSKMVTTSEFEQVINSFNNYKNTTKQYFDFRFDENKKHTDDLCTRTKVLESVVKGDNIKDILGLYNSAKRLGLLIILIVGMIGLAYIGKDRLF